MFKCYDCGGVMEEPRHYQETHGLDTPPYENCSSCYCGGDVSEALQCKICGEWFFEDELLNGFCEKCTIAACDVVASVDYIEQDALMHDCMQEIARDRNLSIKLWALMLENIETKHFFPILKKFCLDEMDCWTEYLQEVM